jgi:recombination protein RecT
MTTAAVDAKPTTDIAGLLTANRGALLQALPKTIQPDRFLRVCLNAIARNPDLQKCTASSLYAGIMQSAQFGLEIGLMNQAHLVPYWNSDTKRYDAQFQIGYLGLRDLAERYGDVTDGDAQTVHEKDLFDYGQGDSPYLTHKPSKEQDRGPVTHYYCWAQPKDGKVKVAVLSATEIANHRDRFVRKKKDGTFGPAWTVTFDAMGLKTVIRHCYKLLARSPELREAIALDELQEIQIPQHLGLELDLEQKDAARVENTKRLEALQRAHVEPVPDQSASRITNEPDADADARAQAQGAVEAPSHAEADAAIAQRDLEQEYRARFTTTFGADANKIQRELVADARLTHETKDRLYTDYAKALKTKAV